MCGLFPLLLALFLFPQFFQKRLHPCCRAIRFRVFGAEIQEKPQPLFVISILRNRDLLIFKNGIILTTNIIRDGNNGELLYPWYNNGIFTIWLSLDNHIVSM